MVIERWRPRWGLTTRSPLREIEDWERQFEDLLGRPIWKPTGERPWIPAVDIFDKDGFPYMTAAISWVDTVI